jgi:hypothetical protein
MSNKTPDKFTIFVPDEQEPDRKLPDRLEIEDYMATTVVMPAGAYNPYEKPQGDTVQMRNLKKQDLRKLSEWIKLKREVEELARVNEAPLAKKEG